LKTQKNLKAKLKDLTKKKKEAGWPPRANHQQYAAKYGGIEIPAIHGLDRVHVPPPQQPKSGVPVFPHVPPQQTHFWSGPLLLVPPTT